MRKIFLAVVGAIGLYESAALDARTLSLPPFRMDTQYQGETYLVVQLLIDVMNISNVDQTVSLTLAPTSNAVCTTDTGTPRQDSYTVAAPVKRSQTISAKNASSFSLEVTCGYIAKKASLSLSDSSGQIFGPTIGWVLANRNGTDVINLFARLLYSLTIDQDAGALTGRMSWKTLSDNPAAIPRGVTSGGQTAELNGGRAF